MERSINGHLLEWSRSHPRKPLIILGARQVGKSFSLREFAEQNYAQVHEFNFQSTSSLHRAFAGDLNPRKILRDLEFLREESIDPTGKSILFFDEIQDCPGALTSLKFFQEEMPDLPIVAAGSLLGIHLAPSSFPVGKVHLLHMYPLSFSEFVGAVASEREQAIFRDACLKPSSLPELAHERFWMLFKAYLVVGGLPESVTTWIEAGGLQGGHKAYTASRDMLVTQITSYLADIAKHAGKVNAMHIERVWLNAPQQLVSAQDETSHRFMFKDVIPGLASYRDLSGPIDWLTKASMLLKVPICHSAQTPITAFTRENIFKLYMFDCGILSAMLNIPPRIIQDFDFGTYKGFLAENFVAQELLASSPSPANPLQLRAWSEGRAEVEFLLEASDGAIPLEVKSGNRIRAQSLKSFINRYHPKTSVILSARMPSTVNQSEIKMVNLPLYLASFLHSVLDLSE